MQFQIEVEREEDGRWIAEVPELPGVMAYGDDRASAIARAQALALRVLAERMEQRGENYLEERARRGSRERYDAALAEVPDVDPDPHDRLAEACANLDPAEERAFAEEGLAADSAAWPDYAETAGEEIGREADSQDAGITERLNKAIGTHDTRLDPAFRRAQAQSIDP